MQVTRSGNLLAGMCIVMDAANRRDSVKIQISTKNRPKSDLPRETQSWPFSHVALYFAGPFKTKLSKIRTAKTSKAYLVLFVCLTVKAVHLDLVSDLTTGACIAL